MASEGARLIGINEVGHIDDPLGDAAGPTDVSWGNTQQQGVILQLTTETVDLMSGQAKMKEDVNLVAAQLQLQIALVTSNLEVFQRAWGLPDAALSGDLSAATPSAEVLTVEEGNLGTETRTLYVLGPGPSDTRRIEAARCRVNDLGDMTFASNAYMLPQATWEVLNPESTDSRDPLTITDGVAA